MIGSQGDKRDKQPHSFREQFRDTNLPNIHIFGQWEEAGVPGENPRPHKENMQTPHCQAQN